MTEYNLLMVGCGNMGSALLSGWLESGLVKRAVIVKPSMDAKFGHQAVSFITTPAEIPADFTPDMVILAVKPQMLNEIVPLYARYAASAPFLSIAAGTKLAFFTKHLGKDAAVIRAMPNLPVTVRRGVTGCVANDHVSDSHRTLATALMAAVGTVHWIKESQMDALTAVSACGPAYVFLLQEVLQKAGQSIGLDENLASSLAREMIIGSAALMDQSLEDPALLRQRITSKGGVTEAALAVLMENGALAILFERAMQAVLVRARELCRVI